MNGFSKKIWLAAALLTALCTLPACSAYFPRDDGGRSKVVVCTPFPDALAIELAKVFQQKTGIEVEQNLDGTTKILARLRIEKRRPRCDVWYSGGGMVPFMTAVREDLLASYTPPALKDLPVKRGNLIMRDSQWRWMALAVVSQGYCYNPKVTPPDQIPKTWDELADPRWKGKIEMWDPAESGTSMLFLEGALQRSIHAPGGSEQAGWKYLAAVFANLKRYTREGKPAFSVARGETGIGLHFENQYLEFLDQQAGGEQLDDTSGNIAWYLPPQSPVMADGIALVKNCPHPENGKKFIDFCLSEEGQKIINRYFFSIYPSMPPPKGLEGVTMDTLMERAMPLDAEWMAANYDRVRQQWQNDIESAAEE